MSFFLGCENVKAINDSGLGIRYDIGEGQRAFQLGGVRPVLSLEAKRRKSRRRGDPELEWEHAGQIFAQMLGQVCYKDFYERDEMEYQEVSILIFYKVDVFLYSGIRTSRKSFISHDLLLQVSKSIFV
jgi:hypothetical protein